MKTQFVGVIFKNDLKQLNNQGEPKVYYFKDNLGSTIGDEVVVRCNDGRLAVVQVIVVSAEEPLLDRKPNAYTVSKVDNTDELKRRAYYENKQRVSQIFNNVVRECLNRLPPQDAARTLLCSLKDTSSTENKPLWDMYFEAEKLVEATKNYEKEYDIV